MTYRICERCNGIVAVYQNLGSRKRALPIPIQSLEGKREQERLHKKYDNKSSRCTCDPMERVSGRRRSAPTSTPTPRRAIPEVIADLKILDDLLNRGVLTRDQYEEARAKLLG